MNIKCIDEKVDGQMFHFNECMHSKEKKPVWSERFATFLSFSIHWSNPCITFLVYIKMLIIQKPNRLLGLTVVLVSVLIQNKQIHVKQPSILLVLGSLVFLIQAC